MARMHEMLHIRTYSKKDYGKDARNAACKTYSKKDYGRATRYASSKSYSFTDKREQEMLHVLEKE